MCKRTGRVARFTLKNKAMEETIENIIGHAMDEVKHYGHCDQYTILDEVSRRLRVESENALKMEYFMEEPEDE